MVETTISDQPNQNFSSGWLNRKFFGGLTPAILFLVAITLLSAILHLVNLQAIGDANTYYTAAVKSMLQSWQNFFFVSAEPGGSVTVDKPPLGLWIEAAFAYVFGVSGVVVSMPNILAGIFSVPLLYHLIKKYLGEAAGLIAGLVWAVTPVVVAVDRNNTMDGMLVFTLLLAAWAFIKAAETSRLRFLLLGAILVGLGFNIKMLQAFLPLPAFYALYFFGAKTGWGKKILHLAAATIVLLVVSLAWVVIVDSIPADQRPYIGSSTDNTVMELIIGHNGLNRLFGEQRGAAPGGQMPAMPQQNNFQPPAGDLASRPNGMIPPDNQAFPGDGNSNPGGQGAFSNEIGQSGMFRFFQPPLAKEMSWLLPLALFGLLLAIVQQKPRLPLISNNHLAIVLWGGWLLTCLIFFSMAEFFHAYYMIMLAPALGACIGLGWQAYRKLYDHAPLVATVLLLLGGLLTLVFQIFLALNYTILTWWIFLPAGFYAASGLILLASVLKTNISEKINQIFRMFALAALFIIPFAWTLMTVVDEAPNVSLPAAYSGQGMAKRFTPGNREPGQSDQTLLNYLEANTQDTKYLVAVPNAMSGSNLVLETGRPVLYIGGFTGSDPVVSTTDLQEMVNNNELRYILYQGGVRGGGQEISSWINSACQAVTNLNTGDQQLGINANTRQPGEMMNTLYQCNPQS